MSGVPVATIFDSVMFFLGVIGVIVADLAVV